MRKLAWVALGFAAAAGLAEYLLPVKGLPYFAAALALLSPLCLLMRGGQRRKALVCVGAAVLGLLCWLTHYVRHVAPCEALAGQTVTITARVTDYAQSWPDYERLEVRVTDGAPEERAVLFLYDGTLPSLRPGDIIQAQVRVTSAVTRRGERSHTYTAQGKNLLGYIQGTVTVTGRSNRAWLYFPQEICQWVKGMCDRLFASDTAPFLKALLTGDTAELRQNEQDYTAMRLAGVLHIVAVSGMHLVILSLMVQSILGKGRRAGLICIPMMLAFTLMTGCRPSIIRAAVMQCLVLFAPLAGREPDGITGLSAALLGLLAANPMAVGSVGLQLSFACMAGFVLLQPRMERWMDACLPMDSRLVRHFANNLSASLCATAFSMPLVALYFGSVPLLSPVSNLLTILAVEICFGGGYALCLLGLAVPGVAAWGGWALNWLARWCRLIYRSVARMPFADLYMNSAWAVVWLVLTYALFVAWYLLRRKKRRLRAGIPVCLAAAGLAAALFAGRLSIGAGEMLLTVLDVDQGQCVILADQESAVVVDCGGSGPDSAGDTAADYLLSIGKTRVDLLVLTHLHADHANGVEALLFRMPVDRIVLPADADGGASLARDIVAAAEAQGTEVDWLQEETLARTGRIALALLLPEKTDEAGDENDQGIVVLAEAAGQQALIMGDAGTGRELSMLERRIAPDVDVLVAGHHGSANASGALFLRAIRAQTAVISVGYNTYGQPAEETLERLEDYCLTVRRTDQEGNVTIRMKENGECDG